MVGSRDLDEVTQAVETHFKVLTVCYRSLLLFSNGAPESLWWIKKKNYTGLLIGMRVTRWWLNFHLNYFINISFKRQPQISGYLSSCWYLLSFLQVEVCLQESTSNQKVLWWSTVELSLRVKGQMTKTTNMYLISCGMGSGIGKYPAWSFTKKEIVTCLKRSCQFFDLWVGMCLHILIFESLDWIN